MRVSVEREEGVEGIGVGRGDEISVMFDEGFWRRVLAKSLAKMFCALQRRRRCCEDNDG